MIFSFDVFKLSGMKYTFIFQKVTDVVENFGGIWYENGMLHTYSEICIFEI